MKNHGKNYTISLQILCIISLQFLIHACGTTSQIKNEQTAEKSFIVLQTKDTIYAEKIRFSRKFNQIGKVKIIKGNKEKMVYGYDEIYQIHQYRKDGNYYVEEMVMLAPNDTVSLTLMDVLINKGSVKLYKHNPTNWGNTPFVVSNFFHGYVRTRSDVDKLLLQLNTCVPFQKKFDKKEQQKSSLTTMLTFYNTNCN
ncbi:hypothetical protein [Kordia jejudonensis]|uniref:hypothetical protein n=1 Tax=Kordia jejudonensis TaxID=1348245 RepID=UPI00138E501F|nr:hypothetical protein [Kordia jejudonensis]